MNAMAPPTAIDIGPRHLTLQWDDGEARVATSLLRQSCRCTDCRRLEAQGGAVTLAPDLSVAGALPVGDYGVQLLFSDGHDRGIYPWSYLRELSRPAGG